MITVFALIENNFYRDPLYDFHIVAGSILRRKQTEERAGCARNAVYMTLQGFAGRINMDFRPLSNSHAPQLGLFEIGGDPHFIERHHGEELLSGLNVEPDDNCFIHRARYRRNDFGVLKVQLGLLEQRSLLLDIGNRRTDARFCGRHLLRSSLSRLVIGVRLG